MVDKFLKEHHIQLGLRAISVLCLIFIGYFLAHLIWMIIAGAEPVQPPIQSKSMRDSPRQAAVVDVPQLQKLMLFGKPIVKKAQPEKIVEAPKTTLQLELLGVFLGTSGGKSSAIIGEINKKPESFSVGDSIASGVTLKEVRSDRVILARNGRYETLEFADTNGKDSGLTATDTQSSAQPSNSQSSFAESRANFLKQSNQTSQESSSSARSNLGRMAKSGQVFDSNEVITAIQKDLDDNPGQVISEMGLVSQGNKSGYVIGSNAPTDLLRTMGLRVGDKVLTVDGQQLGSSTADAGLIQGVMQKGNAQVKIQRGTRTFTVNVDVPR